MKTHITFLTLDPVDPLILCPRQTCWQLYETACCKHTVTVTFCRRLNGIHQANNIDVMDARALNRQSYCNGVVVNDR